MEHEVNNYNNLLEFYEFFFVNGLSNEIMRMECYITTSYWTVK